MVRLLFCVFIFQISYISCYSQILQPKNRICPITKRVRKDNTYEIPAKQILLRYNLDRLFHVVEPSVSFGAEYKLDKNWSALLNMGYHFFSNSYFNQTKTRGFAVNPAVRYYVNTMKRKFFDLHYFYKKISVDKNDWLDKSVVNGVPLYIQKQDFTIQNKENGFAIKFGGQKILVKNKKLFLETSIGFGAKWRKEIIVNEPNSRFRMDAFLRERRTIPNGTTVITIVPITVGFVYVL
jgi:hypothetical protein